MKPNTVIFDIGNVLLRWSPLDVVKIFFPEDEFPHELAVKLFKSPIWFDLNLGKLTEKEAIEIYRQQLDLPKTNFEDLMMAVKESLIPLEGSIELLDELYGQGIPLYSITDNITEIIQFLKARYDFFQKFRGIVVSAEVGVMKPSPIIYRKLIDSHMLKPQESVFIDDLEKNIQGARDVGLQGIHFTDAAQCRLELRRLGLNV
jgi:putative hydrolase of the HAD superfamily